MEDYPDARKFYMQRAWYRRMEFRRRMKKHQRKLAATQKKKTKNEDINSSHSSFEESDGSEDQDISGSDSDESYRTRKEKKMKKQQDEKFMSKFFYNVDAMEEIANDIDQDELERISEDEQTHNRDDLLKARSK